MQSNLDFRSVTPDRWAGFETLFCPRGVCGVCWCVWFRLKRSEFEKQKGEGNRLAMKAIVEVARRSETRPIMRRFIGEH